MRWCRAGRCGSEHEASTKQSKSEGEVGQLAALTSSTAEALSICCDFLTLHHLIGLRGSPKLLSFVIFLVSSLRTAHSDQATAWVWEPSPPVCLPLRCPEGPGQVMAAGRQPHRMTSRSLKLIKYALVDIRRLFPVLTALFFFIAREFYGWCHFSLKRTDHQSFLLT